MDEAQLGTEGDSWFAADIWSLENAGELDWRCPGCSWQVTPVAWQGDRKFKVAAHFRATAGHDKDCGIDGLEKLIKSGENRKVKSESGLPGPYPSAVRFPIRERIVPDETEATQGRGRRVESGRSETLDQEKVRSHRRTVTTIRPVCRFFQNFPNLRHLPLAVPGCTGGSFQEIFHMLRNTPGEEKLPPKILIAGLRFKEEPQYSNDSATLTLNAGRKTTDCIDECYRLSIEWAAWHQRQRTLFSNYVDEQVEDLRGRWLRARALGKPDLPQVTVFFIGTQNPSNPWLIHVDDQRKICILPGSPLG
jgi:hypothetical protein